MPKIPQHDKSVGFSTPHFWMLRVQLDSSSGYGYSHLTCKKHLEAQTFYRQFVVKLSTAHPALQIFLLFFSHTVRKLLGIVTHLTVTGSHRSKHGTQYLLANPGKTMKCTAFRLNMTSYLCKITEVIKNQLGISSTPL